MEKFQKGLIEIVLLILVALGVFIGIIILPKYLNKDTSLTSQAVDLKDQIVPDMRPATPTPFPYQELTIPYLRNYSYEGELSELQLLSNNASYRAYKTSYESEGFKINGYLTIPTEEAPQDGYPAIVFVHGYIPPTIYQTERNYISYVDYLARRGYVVFKIDLRGHDESEGIALGAYYSGAYVIDTLNAYKALQKAEFVNKNKIGLWGHSMGGNVVFRSFVAASNIPAAVIWAGAVYNYSDLGKYGIDDNSYRPPEDDSERQAYREGLREEHGSFVAEDDFWEQVNPVNYLEGVSGAIQINHAIDDQVVNVGYSRDVMEILDNTQTDHELNEFSSGGHNIEGANFNRAMEATVTFYDKYLKGS